MKTNALSELPSGVWQPDRVSEEERVGYSDGDTQEQEIARLIRTAKDLSRYSPELDQPWSEWALEYHLSSTRANLLDGLNLDGLRCALEIGAGCGAITRHLGEQGLEVDAIEGSLRRAEIARSRCRDLDNVNIICANANDLALPDECFDLILFVGVLEYAQRFSAQKGSHADQVVAMLEAALAALKPEGIIVIAIENRLGLRYLAGAREDHHARPWIGVTDYPSQVIPPDDHGFGVRTFDKRQWEQILGRIESIDTGFYYPFPDYKLPKLVVSEPFINEADSKRVFGEIRARDYLGSWNKTLDDVLIRDAAIDGGFLDRLSDSFGIVVSRSSAAVSMALDFDFVAFSDPEYQAAFRFRATKKRGDNQVTYRPLVTGSDQRDRFISSVDGKVPWHPGATLEAHWWRLLISRPEEPTWDDLVQDYWKSIHVFLDQARTDDAIPDPKLRHVILAMNGRWQAVESPYLIPNDTNAAYLLFHAVFDFTLRYHDRFAAIASRLGASNIGDVVSDCFARCGLNWAEHASTCLDYEKRRRAETLASVPVDPESELKKNWFPDLVTPLPVTALSVYWSMEGRPFSEKYMTQTDYSARGGRRSVRVVLPPSACTADRLRIDPTDHRLPPSRRLARIHEIEVVAALPGDSHFPLFNWPASLGGREGEMHGLTVCEGAPVGSVRIEGDDPQIVVDLNTREIAESRSIAVRMEIEWPDAALG